MTYGELYKEALSQPDRETAMRWLEEKASDMAFPLNLTRQEMKKRLLGTIEYIASSDSKDNARKALSFYGVNPPGIRPEDFGQPSLELLVLHALSVNKNARAE
jgi:hypothetical protein